MLATMTWHSLPLPHGAPPDTRVNPSATLFPDAYITTGIGCSGLPPFPGQKPGRWTGLWSPVSSGDGPENRLG